MTAPSTTGLNLLISDKPDIERDALADAFARGGGEVHRLGRFWDPPVFDPATVRVYGADSFCLVLQQKLGLALCSPADDLLLHVPSRFLQRQIVRRTLTDALTTLPAFVKPVTPKQFRGAVYSSPEELSAECRGLPPDTAVLVAEPVTLTAEVRSFVVEGQVLDAAIYEGSGALESSSRRFAMSLLIGSENTPNSRSAWLPQPPEWPAEGPASRPASEPRPISRGVHPIVNRRRSHSSSETNPK
ncbi:ATP-grasp domain-containing protein [Opitutus sp. ER46]|uniref:ATP-grasp domain-containing protein n=1 Tax=Opitutus sp. ER46 TaxID=2161864 RepID=UPI000D321D6C|nr:ATP-grasp domain-containing protein [Opitutus sp. ER46]PTX96559.1 hypothetical protein DB354_07835 [Opitutus sp. ER46]